MSSLRESEFQAEELMAYLDGELEPRRAAALVAHLDHCANCQALANEFRQLSERMLEFRVDPPPLTMNAAVNAELEQLSVERKKSSEPAEEIGIVARIFASRFGWIAACAAIIAAVAIVISLSKSPNPSPMETAQLALNQPNAKKALSTPTAQSSAEVAGVSIPLQDFAVRAPSSARTRNPVGLSTVVAPQAQIAQQPTAVPSQPMIARTASLSIVPSDYDHASTTLQGLAMAHGGYLQSLSTQSQAGSARSLSATFRVPVTQMDTLLADLRKLGHVTSEQQNNADVTSEYVDLDARLKNERATEQRLIDLLATRTGKLEDVLDVERELARVRGDIESMDAQRTLLLHRVDYATVDVQLEEQYQEHVGSDSPNSGNAIWNASVDGFNYLTSGAISALIFLLAYGPSILFWSLLILVPGWLVWRRRRS